MHARAIIMASRPPTFLPRPGGGGGAASAWRPGLPAQPQQVAEDDAADALPNSPFMSARGSEELQPHVGRPPSATPPPPGGSKRLDLENAGGGCCWHQLFG